VLPPSTTRDSGYDALRLAEAVGIEAMPWQENGVLDVCAEREVFDQQLEWAATAAGLIVPRQNGKGGVLEIRALAGVILFGERRILWTAHADKTVEDAHARMSEIFESSPTLKQRLAAGRTNGVLHGKGSRAIRLKNGAEILFFTRSPSAGRGLWADCLFLDEALDLTDGELRILRFTLRTSAIRTGRRAQTIYASTPPDEDVHPNGLVLARLRERALTGRSKSTVWIEHSVPSRAELGLGPFAADPRLTDERFWIQSNPSLGYLFDLGTLQGDKDETDDRGFLLEGLAAPDFWPDPNESDDGEPAIDVETWKRLRDPASRPLDPVVLGIEVSQQKVTSISVAGWRPDGRKHGELIVSAPGTAWAVPVLRKIIDKVDPAELVIDGKGKAGLLLPDIRAAGFEPRVLTSAERSQADEGLAEDVENDLIRLPGRPMPALDDSAESATWRDYGEVKFFDRRTGGASNGPLVSLSLARFGLLAVAAAPPPPPPAPPRTVPNDQVHDEIGVGADLATIGF
jgi:hypothetical protein